MNKIRKISASLLLCGILFFSQALAMYGEFLCFSQHEFAAPFNNFEGWFDFSFHGIKENGMLKKNPYLEDRICDEWFFGFIDATVHAGINIRKLSFYDQDKLKQASLKYAIMRLDTLQALNLCDRNDLDFSVLAKFVPNLVSLNLRDCTSITDEQLIEICRHCHSLKELDLSCHHDGPMNLKTFEGLLYLSGLRYIDVSRTNIPLDVINEVIKRNAGTLKWFDISHNESFSRKTIILPDMPNLRTICFNWYSESCKGLVDLAASAEDAPTLKISAKLKKQLQHLEALYSLVEEF